jgi:hypothetical protein
MHLSLPLGGAVWIYPVPLERHGGLGLLCTPAVLFTHDGRCWSRRTHCMKNRVADPHFWGSALSEPDVTVSRHPAQALRTPLSGRRGGETKKKVTTFTIRTWSRRTLR